LKNIEILREAICRVKINAPFYIDAWVVLPDHLHCFWTLPEDDLKLSMFWQARAGVWRRCVSEHIICDDRDDAAQMHYTHFNPVKHRLVVELADWPYSSFHHAVRMGLYPTCWAGGGVALNGGAEAGA